MFIVRGRSTAPLSPPPSLRPSGWVSYVRFWGRVSDRVSMSNGCRNTRFASSRLVRGAFPTPGASSVWEAASGRRAFSRAALGRRMSGSRDMFPWQAPCFAHRTAAVMSVSFDRSSRLSVAGGGWVPVLDTRLRYTDFLVPRSPYASFALGDFVRTSALYVRPGPRLRGVPVRVGAPLPSACSRVRCCVLLPRGAPLAVRSLRVEALLPLGRPSCFPRSSRSLSVPRSSLGCIEV